MSDCKKVEAELAVVKAKLAAAEQVMEIAGQALLWWMDAAKFGAALANALAETKEKTNDTPDTQTGGS